MEFQMTERTFEARAYAGRILESQWFEQIISKVITILKLSRKMIKPSSDS